MKLEQQWQAESRYCVGRLCCGHRWQGSSTEALATCRTEGSGQPTCRQMPPFQRGGQDLHFICHSACQCQCGAELQRPCQLWLPHCTPALYRLGAGPLQGFAEQQQDLSPLSLGTCISLASFLLEGNFLLTSSI